MLVHKMKIRADERLRNIKKDLLGRSDFVEYRFDVDIQHTSHDLQWPATKNIKKFTPIFSVYITLVFESSYDAILFKKYRGDRLISLLKHHGFFVGKHLKGNRKTIVFSTYIQYGPESADPLELSEMIMNSEMIDCLDIRVVW